MWKFQQTRCAFWLAFIIFGTSLPANALIDPDIKWKILSTDHFEIVYDAKDKDLAKRYALYAETSYLDLLPIFKEAPPKTVILLNNLTDISNGSATPIPYSTIEAYPVSPTIEQTIGHYTHWGRELITHEYTHILQFRPRNGIFKYLKYVFGNIIAPNGLLPRWWLEGLAVETESQLSTGGRMRSSRQQAILRAMTLENRLEKEDISRVNEVSIPDWLGGQRPYLFGSLLWNEIVRQAGNDGIYQLNQRYGGRVPYLINPPIEDLTGKTYQQLLDKVYQDVRKQSEQQVAKIRASQKQKGQAVFPPSSPKEIASRNNQSRGSLSPDGNHFAFIEEGDEFDGRLVIYTRAADEKKAFAKTQATIVSTVSPTQRISWTPDSSAIVYDKIDSFRHYYTFSDLYIYSLKDKKIQQITKGLRAREPAVSPSGKRIAFVLTDGDLFKLSSVDLEGKNLETLYRSRPGLRISHPEFLSSEEIVFSERSARGLEQLSLYNFKTKKLRRVLREYAPAYRPKRTKRGLIFISEKTGVGNVYVANSNLSSAQPLTNVETFADFADWDTRSGQILFSRLSADGYQIWSVNDRHPAQESPTVIPLTVPYQRPAYKAPKLKFKAQNKDYSPWKYLIPRYWIPSAIFSADGLFLAASTGSSDPVGKHAYSALAGYDTGTSKLSSIFSYENQSFSVPISLGVSDLYDFFGSSSVLRHQTVARISGWDYLSWVGDNWTWGGGWEYIQTKVFGSTTVRQGPYLFTRYNNISRRGHQIAPESGGDLLFSAAHYLESLGDVSFTRVQANGSYYFSKWLPKRHVLSSKLRTVYSPNTSNVFGLSTAAGSYESNLVSNQLLMRGYLSGNFIAQNAVNASFEYIFPLKYSYSGYDTWPVFSRHWHGRLVADVITLDGLYFDQRTPSFEFAEFGKVLYTGVGGELHWSTTLGYHMPIRFFVGLYYGLNDEASGGLQTFLGLNL